MRTAEERAQDIVDYFLKDKGQYYWQARHVLTSQFNAFADDIKREIREKNIDKQKTRGEILAEKHINGSQGSIIVTGASKYCSIFLPLKNAPDDMNLLVSNFRGIIASIIDMELDKQ